jgi:flagellar basal-body rod protein FlgF
MIQGLYLASQAMSPLIDKQDQIANNLANINTTGFKESGLFLKAYQKYLANDQLQPYANREVKPDEVYIDYSEGTPNQTGNQLDMMIKGSGFFTVMTPDGVRYTRNGNFSLDRDGFLVTSDGSKVMSTEGYVRCDRMLPVSVNDKGEVLQDNEKKAVLRIADFNKPYKMLREGGGYFKPDLSDANPVVNSQGYVVMQGYLESSNVNVMKNMVQMIAAFRNYEANQKAVLAQDETLQRAVTDVGKV